MLPKHFKASAVTDQVWLLRYRYVIQLYNGGNQRGHRFIGFIQSASVTPRFAALFNGFHPLNTAICLQGVFLNFTKLSRDVVLCQNTGLCYTGILLLLLYAYIHTVHTVMIFRFVTKPYVLELQVPLVVYFIDVVKYTHYANQNESKYALDIQQYK